MARKRATRAHLDYNSPEYWDRLLTKEGLSMDAGAHRFRDMSGNRRYRLSYVGDSSTVEVIYKIQVGDNGRVKPQGAGPDDEGP